MAFGLHALVATYILSIPPRPPPKAPPKKVDRYTKLEAIRERVELPKPEPPKVEPPPEKKPEEKVAEAPKPKPKPKRKRRRGQPKKKKPAAAPKPEQAPPPAPAPLVLSHVNMTGGVAVQAGDEDVLGDPSIAATPENVVQPEGDVVTPTAPPKRVPPRVTRRAVGVYPEGANRLSRVVEVVLRLQIGEEGKVTKVIVVKGAGELFDKEARRTVRRLRFKPGTIDDVPSPMWVPWVVAFEPED